MKLIIDIDDEMVCNDIKNKALEPTSETDKVIINALYNGTPVSNEGDLISREALKKTFIEECCGCCDNCSHCMAGYKCELIDNAPTVSLQDIYQEGYYDGHLEGYTKAINERRPQGEWIDTGDMQEYWAEEYQCSICGAKDHRHNYCPNCGAQMKGGAE